jgi:hypothetical protein
MLACFVPSDIMHGATKSSLTVTIIHFFSNALSMIRGSSFPLTPKSLAV